MFIYVYWAPLVQACILLLSCEGEFDLPFNVTVRPTAEGTIRPAGGTIRPTGGTIRPAMAKFALNLCKLTKCACIFIIIVNCYYNSMQR